MKINDDKQFRVLFGEEKKYDVVIGGKSISIHNAPFKSESNFGRWKEKATINHEY